jgi:hypothetical protein
MTTPLNPQEIYLLERYVSVEYFGKLRDSWGEMVSHLERCLDNFMLNLPSDYRERPRPEQPDVVWGERVVPNFRTTLQKLCDGLIELPNGNFAGLKYSHSVISDFKGQTDYWSGWMNVEDENKSAQLLNSSTQIASNIVATIGASWSPSELTDHYSERDRGALDAPANWPTYQLKKNITIRSGDGITRAGIYVPDILNSGAEFLYPGNGSAPEASASTKIEELFNPSTNEKYGERVIYKKFACAWTLVERLSDSSEIILVQYADPRSTKCLPGAIR